MKNELYIPKLLKFPQHGDKRGKLVVIEGFTDIPFDIKRIFYIYGSDPYVVRGKHANINSEFVLVNVCGSCKVRVVNGKGFDEVYVLDKPHMGIYLPKMYWKEMFAFSPDSILLCLSSEKYDPDEYVRDYEKYIRMMAENDD